MYQVIFKKFNGKNYYHSYLRDGDLMGTIECDVLPPYQDIIQARCCYYDDGEWVFDEDKYLESSGDYNSMIGNSDLCDALIELASTVDDLITEVETIADNIDIVSTLERITDKLKQKQGD